MHQTNHTMIKPSSESWSIQIQSVQKWLGSDTEMYSGKRVIQVHWKASIQLIQFNKLVFFLEPSDLRRMSTPQTLCSLLLAFDPLFWFSSELFWKMWYNMPLLCVVPTNLTNAMGSGTRLKYEMLIAYRSKIKSLKSECNKWIWNLRQLSGWNKTKFTYIPFLKIFILGGQYENPRYIWSAGFFRIFSPELAMLWVMPILWQKFLDFYREVWKFLSQHPIKDVEDAGLELIDPFERKILFQELLYQIQKCKKQTRELYSKMFFMVVYWGLRLIENFQPFCVLHVLFFWVSFLACLFHNISLRIFHTFLPFTTSDCHQAVWENVPSSQLVVFFILLSLSFHLDHCIHVNI